MPPKGIASAMLGGAAADKPAAPKASSAVVSAVRAFRMAFEEGDDEAAATALESAVRACGDYGDEDEMM